jgi:hypothetical protein
MSLTKTTLNININKFVDCYIRKIFLQGRKHACNIIILIIIIIIIRFLYYSVFQQPITKQKLMNKYITNEQIKTKLN